MVFFSILPEQCNMFSNYFVSRIENTALLELVFLLEELSLSLLMLPSSHLSIFDSCTVDLILEPVNIIKSNACIIGHIHLPLRKAYSPFVDTFFLSLMIGLFYFLSKMQALRLLPMS